METVKEKSTEAIAELVIINNDRYEGYKTAAEETTDSELKSEFTKLSQQSNGFSEELRRLIPSSEEAPKRDETKLSGKFYRAWMDVKSALTGKNRKAILSSCEYGEDVALQTYDEVLNDFQDISDDIISLVKRQRAELKQSHDKIKLMRDTA